MEDAWYYGVGGNAQGPVSLAELQSLATAGRIGPDDQVWRAGQAWQRAGDVVGLQFAVTGTAVDRSLGYVGSAAPETTITFRTVEMLRQTAPYVRIMSIVLFTMAGLMVVGSILIVGLGVMSHGDPSMLIGCIYVPLAFLYVVPAVYLFRYATRAKEFGRTRHEQMLESALDAQRSFWKFTAITTLVMIGLYLGLLGCILGAAALRIR